MVPAIGVALAALGLEQYRVAPITTLLSASALAAPSLVAPAARVLWEVLCGLVVALGWTLAWIQRCLLPRLGRCAASVARRSQSILQRRRTAAKDRSLQDGAGTLQTMAAGDAPCFALLSRGAEWDDTV